jgi:hypothetical protein
VTVQPFAVADTEVTVTVEPEQGYALKKLSPMVGKTVLHVSDNLSFTMPAMAVFVTAEFELVPTNIVVDVESGSINEAIMAETDNMHKDVTGVTINLKKDVTYTVSAPIAVPGDIIVNGNGATINVEGVSTALFQLAKPVNNDEGQEIGRRAPETPVKDYEYVSNVIIKDATFKGVKGSIFYDNNIQTCVENFTIENVVMDLATEAVDYQSLIAFEAGCVKDFTIKNSTFSGKNAVAKYFVRCSSKGADFVKGGYTEGSVTYENNTFYGLLLTKDGQWGNNMRYNNNYSKIVLNFNKNIFVDCANGEILRRLTNKDFKNFSKTMDAIESNFKLVAVECAKREGSSPFHAFDSYWALHFNFDTQGYYLRQAYRTNAECQLRRGYALLASYYDMASYSGGEDDTDPRESLTTALTGALRGIEALPAGNSPDDLLGAAFVTRGFYLKRNVYSYTLGRSFNLTRFSPSLATTGVGDFYTDEQVKAYCSRLHGRTVAEDLRLAGLMLDYDANWNNWLAERGGNMSPQNYLGLGVNHEVVGDRWVTRYVPFDAKGYQLREYDGDNHHGVIFLLNN